MELKNNEKLNLVNSLEIIEDSASCGEIEYILIKDNEKNRGTVSYTHLRAHET